MRALTCLGLLCASMAAPAHADTITWRVPVEVRALKPQIQAVKVRCDAFKTVDSTTKRVGEKSGVSAALVPDAQGNVVTTVNVVQQLASGMAAYATSWQCALLLTPPNGFDEAPNAPTDQGLQQAGDALLPAANTPYVGILKGNF